MGLLEYLRTEAFPVFKWFIKRCVNPNFHFLFVYLFKVYLFIRERHSTSGRGAEREKETQNLKQALGSELSAQSPMWGLNSGTAKSRPMPKSHI